MWLAPHNPAFPYRSLVLQVGVGASAVLAFFWPGLGAAQRFAAPCYILLATTLVYAFVRALLRIVLVLPRGFFLVSAYFYFYAGVLGVVISPYMVRFMVHDLGISTPFEEVTIMAGLVPYYLAGAAGAYTELDRERHAV
jgi:hypothetical protein